MRAIGYRKPSPALDALEAFEIPRPTPESRDLLVEVRAVAVNPVDYKVASGTVPAAESRWSATTRPVWWWRPGVRRDFSSQATKCSTPAASADRARTRNIISSTSGSWAGSRARSISPPPPLYR